MRFKDYETHYVKTHQDAKRGNKGFGQIRAEGLDPFNHVEFYRWLMGRASSQNMKHVECIFAAELMWYQVRRPYFRVYPAIADKFMQLSEELSMKGMVLPYTALEVSTSDLTLLVTDTGGEFGIIYNGSSIARIPKDRTIGATVRATLFDSVKKAAVTDPATVAWRKRAVPLLVGTCMLANDDSIVRPVILNKHRRDGMTPAEAADYAERAIKRTGRVGFEVGREIERAKASIHYRNGCFARYYVGKDHEQYPARGEADRVPIIKWRCGSVVNADSVPKVPTGFKDEVTG